MDPMSDLGNRRTAATFTGRCCWQVPIEGTGPTDLVLLHGFQQDHRAWRPLVAGLDGERYRLIAPDLPGCGQSPPPERWEDSTIEVLAADLAGGLADLGIERPVLVGHSLGAAIALQLALDQPALPAGLVLFAPASTRGLDFVPADRVEQLAQPTPEQQRALLRLAFERSPGPSELAVMEEAIDAVDPRHIEGAARSMQRFVVADRLGSVRAPSLLIAGDRDRHVPLVNHVATWQALPDAGLHVFSGVGHVPSWEEPACSVALVERFCRRQLDRG
jgi:sigma-B regulation protein RsbQ